MIGIWRVGLCKRKKGSWPDDLCNISSWRSLILVRSYSVTARLGKHRNAFLTLVGRKVETAQWLRRILETLRHRFMMLEEVVIESDTRSGNCPMRYSVGSRFGCGIGLITIVVAAENYIVTSPTFIESDAVVFSRFLLIWLRLIRGIS